MAGPYATYSALQAAVLDYSARPDLATQAVEFIRHAEIDLQRTLRLRSTAAKATGTVTAGSELVALPEDLIDIRQFWLETSPRRLVYVVAPDTFVTVKENSSGSGIPEVSTFEGLNLKLAPAPSSAMDYELLYWTGIPALSDSSPTNWLLDNGADLLLFGALRFLAIYTQDDEQERRWTTAYYKALPELRKLEERARYGQGPLRMRPDRGTP